MKFAKALTRLKNRTLISAAILVLAVVVVAVWPRHEAPNPVPASSSQTLAQKYLAPCKKQDCINTNLQTITAKYGTKAALGSLQYYVDDIPGSLPGDNHLRTHYIGYQTVKSYGMNSHAFLQCTIIYDYGCMHGFIEQMIWDGITPDKAAKMICGPVESNPKYSSNMKYYCYHGIGHGVMDYEDYNLQNALNMCDELGSQLAQTGCWQGVFMENVSAYVSNAEDNGDFTKADPLSPCDKVASKYQRECYINQEGALFKLFNWNAAQSANACLGAADETETCMEAIGLAASSAPWQKILLTSYGSSSLEYNSWQICQEFPAAYISSCVAGAVTQILEQDGLNFARANTFCSLVANSSATACYQRIGTYTTLQVGNPSKAAGYCDQLSSKGQQTCRQAAST